MRTTSLDVRHGGIPDKCFKTIGEKRDSQSDYLEAMKLIQDRMAENERTAEKIRTGRPSLTR